MVVVVYRRDHMACFLRSQKFSASAAEKCSATADRCLRHSNQQLRAADALQFSLLEIYTYLKDTLCYTRLPQSFLSYLFQYAAHPWQVTDGSFDSISLQKVKVTTIEERKIPGSRLVTELLH